MARIVVGVVQVALGLLMVWLSKRFIDETIRTGTADDVIQMVAFLHLSLGSRREEALAWTVLKFTFISRMIRLMKCLC